MNALVYGPSGAGKTVNSTSVKAEKRKLMEEEEGYLVDNHILVMLIYLNQINIFKQKEEKQVFMTLIFLKK